MILRAITGLIVLVHVSSCTWQTSIKGQSPEADPLVQGHTGTGLKIEYKPTRGQNYTDPNGDVYQLRHIPTSIENDSTVPIHVQINLQEEYENPPLSNHRQFRAFPMPAEWAMDGIQVSDKMLLELAKYVREPFLSKTLEPGEKWLLAFGTLKPTGGSYGVFPVAVFSHNDRALHHQCNQLVDPNNLDISPLEIELLIGYTGGSQASPDSCLTIPCGRISY